MRAYIHTQPQDAKLIADVGFPIQEYPTVAILVFLVKGSWIPKTLTWDAQRNNVNKLQQTDKGTESVSKTNSIPSKPQIGRIFVEHLQYFKGSVKIHVTTLAKLKGKGKVHHRTEHEGQEGE
jgi:hypothetical protein